MAARKTNIYTCGCCRKGAKVLQFTGLFTFHILPHVQSFVKCFVKVFKFYKRLNLTNMIIGM